MVISKEEEAFIAGMELAKDWGLTSDIPPEDFLRYEQLTARREEDGKEEM